MHDNYRYHANKLPSRLTLLPVGEAAPGACVCPEKPAAFGQATGQLVYAPWRCGVALSRHSFCVSSAGIVVCVTTETKCSLRESKDKPRADDIAPAQAKCVRGATSVLCGNRYHRTNQSVDVGGGAVAFGRSKCAPFPATVLNEQRNPTCDIRYYQGGQWACHHLWSLLDADQEIPWTDTPLVLHHKWRIYVQPFNASYHTRLTYGFDASLLIGSPYEYDVPNCSATGGGVPGCALGGPDNKTWIHTITGAKRGTDTFAQLNFHCHAPTCLSMAVYACPAGTALTDCNASTGKLICEQRPVCVLDTCTVLWWST
jgi:hypothetical protein